MRAGHGHGVAQLAVAKVARERRRHQRAAACCGHGIDQARIGMIAAPEAHHRPGMARSREAQAFIVRVIRRNDRHAAHFQPLEDLGLGVGNRFLARKVADMRGRDGGDDGHMRAHEAGQRGKLTRVVHAHFQHAKAAARRHPRQAERHADMVVVAFDRTVRAAPAAPVERSKQRLLHTGFACRAGHADDRGINARAGSMAQIDQRLRGVLNQNVRPLHRVFNQRRRCTTGKCALQKAVPVALRTLQRNEQVAGQNLAAVNRAARHGKLA